MENKEKIIARRDEKKNELENVKQELLKHEKVFESQINPLKENIASKRKLIDQIPREKASPLFDVGAVLMVLFGLINIFYFHWDKVVTYTALVAAAFIWILKVCKQKKLDKPGKEAEQKLNSEIAMLKEEIRKIERTDPEISRLREQKHSLSSEISDLNVKIKDLEIEELIEKKIGTNNLIIRLDNDRSSYYYWDELKNKFVDANKYWGRVSVDGSYRATIDMPFTIIPLGEGIHSVDVEFDPNVGDGVSFTNHVGQFSLKNSNKYISYKKLKYLTARDGFSCDSNVTTSRKEFLEHSGISEEDFIKHIKLL